MSHGMKWLVQENTHYKHHPIASRLTNGPHIFHRGHPIRQRSTGRRGKVVERRSLTVIVKWENGDREEIEMFNPEYHINWR